MKILEDMILERGIAVNEDILKVDSFVNHQVDPELMKISVMNLLSILRDRVSQRLQPSKVPALLRH